MKCNFLLRLLFPFVQGAYNYEGRYCFIKLCREMKRRVVRNYYTLKTFPSEHIVETIILKLLRDINLQAQALS